MRFEFALTIDDLREALVPTRPDGRPGPPKGSFGLGILGWVVFIALLLVIFHLVTGPGAHTSGAPPQPSVVSSQNLWVTLVPNLVPALMIAWVYTATWACHALRFRRLRAALAAGRLAPPPPGPATWIGAVAIMPVALLLLVMVPSFEVGWSPSPFKALCVAESPWMALALLVGTVSMGRPRAMAERQWVADPSFRRTLAFDVTEFGVWATDGLCDSLYRWPAIVRYRETETLLILTLEDARVLLLPKQAVPDGGALRGLIQSHVAEGTFLRRAAAFPVSVITVPGELNESPRMP